MKTGAQLIADERKRQIEKEGWTKEHDSQHNYLEFVKAAISYCIVNFSEEQAKEDSKAWWPWDEKWYKPKDNLKDLVRAGALIAAAIDRLQKDKTK